MRRWDRVFFAPIGSLLGQAGGRLGISMETIKSGRGIKKERIYPAGANR
jgi:hypothetical protein